MPSIRCSRLAPVRGPHDNSARGSCVKRPCRLCSRTERQVKETIHNGMTLLRVRWGIPYCELPDVTPSLLGRYLAFLLLQGKERTSVEFPRRQRLGDDGLCSLQRLCRRDRWALAHSLSSIKRNLPKGCHLHTPSSRHSWETAATSQPPPTSSEYLQFVRAEVSRLFPSGWDRSYGSFVWNHLPNTTSRLSRETASNLWLGRRGEFVTACLTESEEILPFRARYKEVQSAGKKRPLLIYDERIELLAPLHKLLYRKLCDKDWLLCGPPSAKRMSSVCVNAHQTSVDLVNATDGLAHDVSREILSTLFFSSKNVPRSIRSLANLSLEPLFETLAGGVGRVTHGQMMGAYLSFPLLCIHSYVAARWAARFDLDARFLVNGDDCVISASRGVTVQDYPSGYRLNDDKTIRAENVAEVNSTCFLRQGGGKWREVRHLRRGGAVTDFRGMIHMASAVLISPGFVDAFQRARIGRRWGFTPSQLGHSTYPSWLRQLGFVHRRHHTALPEAPLTVDDRLVACRGKPTAVEAEALRSFFWEHSREGRKRDEWNPSCGSVRRTYSYRAQPLRYLTSFVGWRGPKSCFLRVKKPRYFLPADFVTEEEEEGLRLLDLWRHALDSRVAE
nr:MAG: RNA-dependent RNA polymerase [Dracophyllum associated botourmia-like virus 70]